MADVQVVGMTVDMVHGSAGAEEHAGLGIGWLHPMSRLGCDWGAVEPWSGPGLGHSLDCR